MQLFRSIPAWAVLSIAALWATNASAAEPLVAAPIVAAPIVVDSSFSQLTLEHHVDVLEDPTGRMDFEAVRNASAFKPAPDVGTNFGFTRSAWWLRFTLSNTGDHDYQALLREDYPLIDYLDLWADRGDGTWRHVTPLSSDSRMIPCSPTATSRDPARAPPRSIVCNACGTIKAGRDATAGGGSAAKAGAGAAEPRIKIHPKPLQDRMVRIVLDSTSPLNI